MFDRTFLVRSSQGAVLNVAATAVRAVLWPVMARRYSLLPTPTKYCTSGAVRLGPLCAR